MPNANILVKRLILILRCLHVLQCKGAVLFYVQKILLLFPVFAVAPDQESCLTDDYKNRNIAHRLQWNIIQEKHYHRHQKHCCCHRIWFSDILSYHIPQAFFGYNEIPDSQALQLSADSCDVYGKGIVIHKAVAFPQLGHNGIS